MIKLLLLYLKVLPHRKHEHSFIVALYIHFGGDNQKVYEFLIKGQTLPDFQVNEILEKVNVRDYITPYYPIKFARYCAKHDIDIKQTICVKKEA